MAIVDRMKDEAFVMLVQKMQQTRAAGDARCLNVLLIARNLERIADHATNIAEDVIFWVAAPSPARRRALPALRRSRSALFRQCVSSPVSGLRRPPGKASQDHQPCWYHSDGQFRDRQRFSL